MMADGIAWAGRRERRWEREIDWKGTRHNLNIRAREKIHFKK